MKNPPLPKPRTLKAFLVGDLRMAIGNVTLTDQHTIEDFATEAYKMARGSLKRLMQPKWRVVIVDEHGVENGFGLEKWNKLIDPGAEELKRAELRRKAREQAAKIYGTA